MKKFLSALLSSLCFLSCLSANPFSIGSRHNWSTSAGQSGSIRVASVSGNNFVLEQTNVRNKAAGIVILDGEVLGDGSIRIVNKRWNEVWLGTPTSKGLVGKVNGVGSFRIDGIYPQGYGYIPFGVGQIYGWDTSVGRGTMHVVSTNGLSFKLIQYNDYNHAAGGVPMSGEILQNGEVVIRNPRYNEVWRGYVGQNEIVGNVNNFIPFRISDIDENILVAYHRHFPSSSKYYSDFRKKTPHFDGHKPFHPPNVKGKPQPKPQPKYQTKPPVKQQAKPQPQKKNVSTKTQNPPAKAKPAPSKQPQNKYVPVGQKQPYFQKSKKSNAKSNAPKKDGKKNDNFFDDFKRLF